MTYPYVSGAVLLASDLNTDFASKTDLAMTQNAQTGTTYSFALADASKLLTTSNASPVSVTVTKQATVTWVTGTQLRIMNLGAGVTTLVADTGVTINGNVALKQYQGGTLIRTASDVWLFVPTASGSGMDLITPTSVAGSGVTLSGGEVSFSAASTVTINGCFSSAYDNYQFVLTGVASVGGADISLRLAAAGTPNTGTYNRQRLAAQAASVTGSRLASNLFRVSAMGTAEGNIVNCSISSPFLSQQAGFISVGNYTDSGAAVESASGNHQVSTSFDGLYIFPSSGTITGKIRIYGLRNS